MASPMARVNELVSASIGNTLSSIKTWGSVITNIKEYGAMGDGVANDTEALRKVAENAEGQTIAFPAGKYVVKGDVTFPENTTLWFLEGATLIIDDTVTVTINGSIDAGMSQIFSVTGNVRGQIKNAVIYPKWWGMTETSPSESSNNYKKLVKMLQTGMRVVIDNEYYLSGNDLSVGKVDIVGLNGKIIVNSNQTRISFNGDLSLDNIEIETVSLSGTPQSLFYNNKSDYIKRVSITNCVMIGNVNVLEIDRPVASEKVESIDFNNNKIVGNMKSCVYFRRVNFDNFNIKDNTVRNMDRQIINTDSFGNASSVTTILNNDVRNDLSFWASEGTSYLCFVLYDGAGTIVYKNNIVSGLKTKLTSTSVYDNYFSCDRLIYENNEWEDNISVHASKGKNSLFKAKTGPGETIYRVCRNNSFIITDELKKSLTSTELNNSYVRLWDFSTLLSTFVFENNYIDVYYLWQDEYDPAQLCMFNKNTIKAVLTRGPIVNINGDGTGNSKVIITNNVITSESTTYDALLYSPSSTTASSPHAEIIVENNSVKLCFTYLLYLLNCNVFVFNNNTIDSLKAGATQSITHYGKIGKMVGGGNRIYTPTDFYTIRGNSTIGESDYSQEIRRKSYSATSDPWPFVLSPTLESSKKVVRMVTLMTDNEVCMLKVNFAIGVDETGVYLKYTNTSDVLTTTYSSGTYSMKVFPLNTYSTGITASVIFSPSTSTASLRVSLPNAEAVEQSKTSTFSTRI